MSLYWLACAAIALRTGYFGILINKEALSSLRSSFPSFKLVSFSLLATLAPQPLYFLAVSERAAEARPGGRDWGAIATFALVNSVLETAVFKLMVDLGAAAAAAAARLSLSPLFFSLSASPPPPPPSPSFPSSLQASVSSFLLLSAYAG